MSHRGSIFTAGSCHISFFESCFPPYRAKMVTLIIANLLLMAVKKTISLYLGPLQYPSPYYKPFSHFADPLPHYPPPPIPIPPPQSITHYMIFCMEINCIFLLVFFLLLLLPYKFPIKNLEITHEYNPFPHHTYLSQLKLNPLPIWS